jgi:hypothetical protein
MYETTEIPAIGPVRPYRPDAGVLWYRLIFGSFLFIGWVSVILILHAAVGQ